MNSPIIPKITLVGAGPGDPELLTIKAWKALQQADVVLYDALVSEEVLDLARPGAILVDVGKRASKHTHPQEDINWMLVEYAINHGHVVRLKGGDPFVFGRGYEEMAHAAMFGIKVDIVPGLSSCIAVPGLQGVPVTCRGVNESFWVVTGTTRAGTISKDIELAAQSTATTIILMGMRKLADIMAIFAAQGKMDTPAMVVQNGSTPAEKVVLGRVHNLAERVALADASSPGIIVVGDVVALHPEYKKTEPADVALQNRGKVTHAHITV
ncbi:MAG TPA: uroporphyrinogen-III C-methyltransferase [Haliscomenobacter sp.]|uniref:uroporphyrinogen-III C-methyltransferase n=1 Tax=Haliscomenobacter sp. TaxID=2717303 RepID=UPI002B9C6FD5|nr:uroporphyrinogen-III C-methyltransferase [Haliscomenobacter sp.]HOY18487.1 uroporphyrinogen-III C-methyltransferase [Haliscomenobacter sp.]HPH21746.1 uroporphyrinogen-III C-methyltransferase [Haliscomenobacter sp.]